MNEDPKDNEDLLPNLGKIMHVAGLIETRLEASLNGLGLNLSKFAVLNQLMKAGAPLPLTRLAERLSCVKSNITQLVDRLENDGLVARMDDPDDRRSVLAVVKDEGRRRYKLAARAIAEAERELQLPFSNEEIELLSRLMDRFIK